MGIKGYKGTYNYMCRSMKFTVGETYNYDGEIALCNRGYHFCLKPDNVLSYYPLRHDFKLLEVECIGKIVNGGDKAVTDKIKILREIDDFQEIKALLKVDKPTEIMSNFTYFSSLKNFNKIDYYIPVNWTSLGTKLDNKILKDCYDIIRSKANCNWNVPVVIVDDENSIPILKGRSGGWFTKGGCRIDHPSSYSRKGWSNMIYRCSTYRVEVGINWIKENGLFEKISKLINYNEKQAA